MRIALRSSARQRGIALIIVLIAILVLALLAGGFARSMKVETKLARNASYETELEWMGRSAVELARYALGQQLLITSEPYDSLNQKWAGGPGGIGTTNSPLADLQLENVEVGNGRFSVKIVDMERKFNVNLANELMLQQALIVMGVDAAEAPTVVNAILDWIDRDDLTRVSGAETDYYQAFNPPYVAKNGPVDDMAELLLVKGVTPELFWGPACTNHSLAAFQTKAGQFDWAKTLPTFSAGLVDFFTPLSSGKLNINTASTTVLQMVPGIDVNTAAEIVRLRAGLDGMDGTDDDTPLRNPGELVNVGLNRQIVQELFRFCDVRSRTFEVRVDAEISGYKRQFVAVLGRNSVRDIQILSFYWR